LIQDRDSAQSMIDIAYNACQDCKATRERTFANEIAAADTAQGDAGADFHDCKIIPSDAQLLQKLKTPTDPFGEEHDHGYDFNRTWNDEEHHHALGNTSHEHHAVLNHQRLCGDLNLYVQGFAPLDQADFEFCKQPSTSWHDSFRFNLELTSNSYDWFHRMDDWEELHFTTYKEKREACHEARHRHQIRVAECHRIQHDYEAKYCGFAGAIDAACSSYSSCYDREYAAFVTQNQTVNDMEVQFKAQQHALEHLLCYGDEILADRTNLTNCDDVACTGCERLSINYPTPHDKIDCDEEVATRPCQDDWNDKTYGSYSGTSILADVCHPCPE